MDNRLKTNITALGFWLEETWSFVDKVQEDEYHVEAIQLLTVAARYWELLSDFTDDLDSGSIDFCILAILNILSVLKYQVKSFNRKGFKALDKETRIKTLKTLHNMRHQMNDDFSLIIEEYGLTELY